MKYKFIWWDRYQTHIISTPVLWVIALILIGAILLNTDNNFHLRWRIASIFKGRFHKKILRKSVVIHQTGGRTFHITWSSLKWSLKDGTKKDVLKVTKNIKKNISTLAWYRYVFFEEKSFVTHWVTSFSHYLVKHDGPSDHWRIGLKKMY